VAAELPRVTDEVAKAFVKDLQVRYIAYLEIASFLDYRVMES
jgi:hypothetical protein